MGSGPTYKTSPTRRLSSFIEIERTADPVEAVAAYTPMIGIDASVVENLEELLERVSDPDLSHFVEPAANSDVTSILRRISEIEKKLKACEAESKALKSMLMKLH